MKTKVYFLMLFVVSQLFIFTSIASANDGTSIVLKIDDPYMFVNGGQTEVDLGKGTTPVVVEGRTLLPIRSVVESIYGAVYWNAEDQKVTIKAAQNTIELWVNKTTGKINDVEKTLDVAPTIINDRTMMPVRFIAEALNCIVDWNEKTRTVGILSLPNDVKDKYVANIGGMMISRELYNLYLIHEKNLISAETSNNVSQENLWAVGADGKDNWAIVREKTLSDLQEHAIQLLKSKEAGLKPDIKEIEAINAQVDSSFANYSDELVVTQYGVDKATFKELMHDMLITQKYSSKQLNEIKPTESEIAQEYEKSKNDYDTVKVRHILFFTQDQNRQPFSDEKKAEVLKKAQDTLERIKNGEDMKKLALELSDDTMVQENSGEYSFMNSEGYVQEFKDWAFKAKVSDIGIVESAFGYHIMRLESRTTFEQAKLNVEKPLTIKMYLNMLNELKTTAKYRIIINQNVYDTFKP